MNKLYSLLPSAQQTKGRRPLDYYPTPPGLTHALLSYVPHIGGHVGELCAGELDMADILAQHPVVTRVTTNDVDRQRPTNYHGDAADPGAACYTENYDWVVTNPPFNRAADILATAYKRVQVGVAFLVRLTFLEPVSGRGDWLERHAEELSHMLIFGQPRPSFTGNGTDSVTTAWLVWQRGYSAGTRVRFITGWK